MPDLRRTDIARLDGDVLGLRAGAAKIGHFNFFRADFRDTLWKDAADWLGTK